MPRKPLPWFRFYCEAMRDPKLRRRPEGERWTWLAVLTIARESPEPGRLLLDQGMPATIADIADLAAVSMKTARSAVGYFLASPGMLEQADETYVAVNFGERQYESDTSTKRTRLHRSKERGRNVPTPGDGTESLSETSDIRHSEGSSDADASSSSDDDDPIFSEALKQWADRKMIGQSVLNRPAYRAKVMSEDRVEFGPLRTAHPDLDIDALLLAFEKGPEDFAAHANAEMRAAETRRRIILGEIQWLRDRNEDGGNDAEIAELEVEFVSLRAAAGIEEMAS